MSQRARGMTKGVHYITFPVHCHLEMTWTKQACYTHSIFTVLVLPLGIYSWHTTMLILGKLPWYSRPRLSLQFEDYPALLLAHRLFSSILVMLTPSSWLTPAVYFCSHCISDRCTINTSSWVKSTFGPPLVLSLAHKCLYPHGRSWYDGRYSPPASARYAYALYFTVSHTFPWTPHGHLMDFA